MLAPGQWGCASTATAASPTHRDAHLTVPPSPEGFKGAQAWDRPLPCSMDGEQQHGLSNHMTPTKNSCWPYTRSLPAPRFGGSQVQVSPDVHLSSWTDFNSPLPLPATTGMVLQSAAWGSSLPSLCTKSELCDTSGHSLSASHTAQRCRPCL